MSQPIKPKRVLQIPIRIKVRKNWLTSGLKKRPIRTREILLCLLQLLRQGTVNVLAVDTKVNEVNITVPNEAVGVKSIKSTRARLINANGQLHAHVQDHDRVIVVIEIEVTIIKSLPRAQSPSIVTDEEAIRPDF